MKLGFMILTSLLLSPGFALAEVWTCTGKPDGVASVSVTLDYANNQASGQLNDRGTFAYYAPYALTAAPNQLDDLKGGDSAGHDYNEYEVRLVQTGDGDGLGKAVVFTHKVVDCVGDFSDVEVLTCTIAE